MSALRLFEIRPKRAMVVEQGLESPPENPFTQAVHGFLLGSQSFVDKIRKEMKPPQFEDEVPRARLVKSFDLESVFEAVIRYYQVDREILSTRSICLPRFEISTRPRPPTLHCTTIRRRTFSQLIVFGPLYL